MLLSVDDALAAAAAGVEFVEVAAAIAFFFGVTQFVVGFISSEVDMVTIFFVSVLLLSPSSWRCCDSSVA